MLNWLQVACIASIRCLLGVHSTGCGGKSRVHLFSQCLCIAVCERILPGPEAVIRTAVPTMKTSEAQAVLHRAVNDALHLLSLLRLVRFPLPPQLANMWRPICSPQLSQRPEPASQWPLGPALLFIGVHELVISRVAVMCYASADLAADDTGNFSCRVRLGAEAVPPQPALPESGSDRCPRVSYVRTRQQVCMCSRCGSA